MSLFRSACTAQPPAPKVKVYSELQSFRLCLYDHTMQALYDVNTDAVLRVHTELRPSSGEALGEARFNGLSVDTPRENSGHCNLTKGYNCSCHSCYSCTGAQGRGSSRDVSPRERSGFEPRPFPALTGRGDPESVSTPAHQKVKFSLSLNK
jgi:hypothetical protein